MNKEKGKTIKTLGLERTKKIIGRESLYIAILFVILICVLALAIVHPFSLYLTVPFIAVPAAFAFQGINCVCDIQQPKGLLSYFALFKAYFSNHFFGTYRVITSFLKALLTALIISSIILTIGFTVIYFTNAPLFDEFMILTYSEEYVDFAALENLIYNDKVFRIFYDISFYASEAGGFIMLLHSLLFNSGKEYFNLLNPNPIFRKDLNTVFAVTYKNCKKEYRKDYRQCYWFLIPILLLGFAGGVCFGYFVLKQSQFINIVLGYFGALIFTLPFVSYYFDCSLMLFKKYSTFYSATFVKLSIETVKQLKKNQAISKEKEKEIMDFIDRQKADDSKESKDNKDEKNHD